MSESRYSRHNRPRNQLDMIDMIIATLLEHEKKMDQLEQNLDDQLLKLQALRTELCDLTDRLAEIVRRLGK